MNQLPVVSVTGVGCICAAGKNIDECKTALTKGGRHPAPPTLFSTQHGTPYPVFEIPENTFLWGKAWERRLFRTTRLAMTAAMEALSDAQLCKEDLHQWRIGVCMGTTVGCTMNHEDFYWEFRAGGRPDIGPIERYLGNNPAQVVARTLKITGPCQTVVNACSSGTDAIGLGASWIRSGMCDSVIVGGADELSCVTYNGFISLMITDPSPCRPFDRDRKGLNLGEGAGVLILESEAMRLSRNRPSRAQLLGYGTSCDAHHLTAPDPEGGGLRRAIRDAIRESALDPGSIGFVNAHGTGTLDNDRVESRVLSQELPGIPFFSTKGLTGHTLGAAGAIEAAFTILCLKAGELPPSAGFANPDPELPASPTRMRTGLTGDTALSQSLAFGGSNSALIFRKGTA